MRTDFNIDNRGLLVKLPIQFRMIFVLLITILQLSSCSAAQQRFTPEAELGRNMKLWRDNKFTDYNFSMVKNVGGMSAWVPVLVKVRAGKAASVEPTRERLELEKMEGYENFDTVEKCFERIQESYDRGEKNKVIYNKESGYPEIMIFDPMPSAIDTKYSIEISKFEAVKN